MFQNYQQQKSIDTLLQQSLRDMKSLSFNKDKDAQLQQLLKGEHPADCILKCLFQPQREFVANLQQTTNIDGSNYVKMLMPQKMRRLVSIKLYDRLSKWQDWSLLSKPQPFHQLNQFVQMLCLEKQQRFEILAMLVHKVQDPALILGLLQKTFVLERESKKKMEQQSLQIIKQFLMSTHSALKNLPAEGPLKEAFQSMSTQQKKRVTLQIIRIFSHIFFDEDMSVFQLDSLFVGLQKIKDYSEVQALISINCQQAVNLIKSILSYTIDKIQNGYELINSSQLDKTFFSNQLLSDIFEYSSQGYSFFRLQSESIENKEVILRYSLVELSQGALSNILPHLLIKQKQADIYQKQSQFFLGRYKEILSVLAKINDGWMFSMIRLNSGEVTLVDCDREKITEVCLQVWSNILNQMMILDDSSDWSEYGTYNLFHKVEECKPQFILSTFEKILNNLQASNMKVLKQMCFIFRFYRRVNEYQYDKFYKNKAFFSLFIQKIKKAALMAQQSPLDVQLTQFFTESLGQFKGSGYELNELPINNHPTFRAVIDETLNQQRYQHKSCKESRFFRHGLFESDNYNIEFHNNFFKFYSDYKKLFSQRCYSMLEKIDSAPYFTRLDINKDIIEKLTQAINDQNLEITSEQAEIWRQFLKKIPGLCLDIRHLGQFMKKIKVNAVQEEKVLIQELLLILRKNDLIILDPKVLIDSIWTDHPLFLELSQKLEYWFLLMPQSSRLLNPDMIYQYREILILLKQLMITLKERIIGYLASLEATYLQGLKKYYETASQSFYKEKLAKQTKMLFSRILQNLAFTDRQTFYNFLIKDSFFLDLLENNLSNGSMTRSILQLIYKCINDIARYGKKTTFGLNFYYKGKERLQRLLCEVYLKWDVEGKKNSDRSDDSNYPSIDGSGIELVINSKEKNQNSIQNYQRKIQVYVFANVQELLQSLFIINTSSQSAALNNKLYRGVNNMVLLQKSAVVDILRGAVSNFKPEHIKYYNFILSKMIGNIQELKDYMDKDIPSQIVQSVLDTDPPTLSLLDQKQCDRNYSQTIVQFIRQLISCSSDEDAKQQLIQLLLDSLPQKEALQQEKESLVRICFSKCQQILQKEPKNLKKLSEQLRWFAILGKDIKKERFLAIIDVKFLNNLLILLSSTLSKFNPQPLAEENVESDKSEKKEVDLIESKKQDSIFDKVQQQKSISEIEGQQRAAKVELQPPESKEPKDQSSTKEVEPKTELSAQSNKQLQDSNDNLQEQNKTENLQKNEEQQKNFNQNQSSMSYLEKLLPFLSRLVPEFQGQDQSEEVILYTKNILSIIVKIAEIAQFSDEDYFLEIATKIASSHHEEVTKFTNYFLTKSGNTHTASIMYQVTEKLFEQPLMESEIKGYFFKRTGQEQKLGNEVESELDDLAYAFMTKYGKKLDRFRDLLLRFAQRFTNNSNKACIRYIPRENFDFCRSLGSNFIHFKPPLVVRSQIQHITAILAKSIEDSSQWLQTLEKIIFYCPILIPTILFQTVTTNSNQGLSFLDFLIKVSIQGNQKTRKLIEFLCIDHSSLIRGKDKVYFISQFVCYRVLQLVSQSQLTSQCLRFIFCLLSFKAFARICNCKILKDKKSLRDLIEQKFTSKSKVDAGEGDEDTAGNVVNNEALITLTILYRCEHLSSLSPFLEKKRTNQRTTLNIAEACAADYDVPFAKIAADQLIAAQELYVLNENQLLSEMQAFASISESIKHSHKDNLQGEFDMNKDLYLKATVLTPEIQSRIGSVLKVEQLEDIPRDVKSCMNGNWRNILRLMERWEKEQEKQNLASEARSLLEPQEDQSQASVEQKEESVQPISRLQPTRFAVQDYALQSLAPKHQGQEDDQKVALMKFLEVFNQEDTTAVSLSTTKKEHQIDLTSQMVQIISNINSILSSQGKPLINLSQCQAQTEEAILEWLRNKQIETQFDYKEASTGTAQFQAYCLSNALRLERLPSAKRNKVKVIEEHMLQSYLQRTVSGDEIDYLIDTIDQNYQQLSKLERRLTKVQDVYTNLKPQRKKHFLSAEQIPRHAFSEISEQLLWTVVLSFYQQTILIEVQSLVPFLQNRSNRDKLINTLLFVLRNPFQNGAFPTSIHHFSEKTRKSPEEELKVFRLKVLRFILSVRSHGLYNDERYLLQQVDYKGLKEVILTPVPELAEYFNPEKHVPILELVLLGLSSNLTNQEKAGLLWGLSSFPNSILEKIFAFINQLNTLFTQLSNAGKNQGNRVSNYFSYRKQYKSHLNFATILRNTQVKEHIRQVYPISENLPLDPFIYCLLMNSDVYSPQEYKVIHSIILKRDAKKDSDIFFCGEVLKYYSDQQLRTVPWLRHDSDLYVSVFEKHVGFLSGLQAIAKEQIFRLLKVSETLHFKIKSQILSIQVQEQKDNINFETSSPQVLAKREKGIFQSAFQQLRYEPDGFWLYDFDVKFVGLDGKKQSGYGGGVAKEWYTYVTKGMVNLNYGLFTKTSKNYYYINRQSWINPRHLQFFEFIGKIFALSIINPKFFLTPRFSIIIYKAIVGQEVTMKDIINEFDEGEVISNIEKMREYTDDSLFCENFVYLDKGLMADGKLADSVNQDSSHQYLLKETEYLNEEGMSEEEMNVKMLKVLKVGKTIELLPGGKDIPVTKDNLEDFIRLTKEKIYQIIVGQTQRQINAFIEGVRKVISIKYLKKFTAVELRELAEGADAISVEDIKKHAKISINKNQRCLELFWQVFEQLPSEDKIHFIHHWTGIPKISAEGIEEMNLQIRERSDEVRIFAHTCFNRIYLPPLQDKEAVREAVLLAVNSVKHGMSVIED